MSKEYVGVEIESVAHFVDENGGQEVKRVAPSKADAWAVYLRTKEGLAEWFADVGTKKAAEFISDALRDKYGVSRRRTA